MNDAPKDLEPGLYNIIYGLLVSCARAENLAEKIKRMDPQAAVVIRQFAEELTDVWARYQPLMPTNKDISLLLNPHSNDSRIQSPNGIQAVS